MKDLKDYRPADIRFKLPTTVSFPEAIFPECKTIDDIRKVLTEHFVAVQEKDVIANRLLDSYEIATIRENYGEIAEALIPEQEKELEDLINDYKSAKKELEAKLSAPHTQFKDLVSLSREGIKDFPLDIANTFRIPAAGHYLYYTWLEGSFRLALVQKIPPHEYGDLFNTGGRNDEAFKKLGYTLPDINLKDPRKNVRVIKGKEVWEEDGYDVWVEEWIDDFMDEDSGEVVSITRRETQRVLIEESPYRNEPVKKSKRKAKQVQEEPEG